MSVPAWLCAALLLGIGCRSRPSDASPRPCDPTTASLPAGATAEALSGRYRLQVVASSGPSEGRTVTGQLQLEPYPETERQRPWAVGVPDTINAYPLHGSAAVQFDSLGAVAGDLSSADQDRPGVLVIRMPPQSDTAGPRIILRLGADANQRGVARFDGGYTVLRVREISDEGFAGDWESGAPLPRARGHFCAVRADEGQ